MARTKRRYTVEDFERLPEDWLVELVGGELVMSAAPSRRHAHIVRELVLALCTHLGPGARERVLVGPVDVRFDEENVFQPDVLVLPEGVGLAHPDWESALPVWVAEILSPRTARYDRHEKMPVYASSGVREVWLVSPADRVVEVHDLVAGTQRTWRDGDLASSRALEGLEVDVSALFGP